MSEDAGTAPAAPETGPAEEGASDGTELTPEEQAEFEAATADDGTDLAAEVEKWKALARKHETRARGNAAAAKELEQIKQAGMTELEKAQADLATATRERDEARADHARIMAAAANDLPMELIDDLGSGTDEEINERAERFAQVIEAEVQKRVAEITGATQGSRNGTQAARPVESMRAGSAPAQGDTPTTPDGWFRQLLENR